MLTIICQFLELINPEAFGRRARIVRYVKEIASRMEVPDLWQIEIRRRTVSNWMCHFTGKTALQKLYQGQELTGEEETAL